MSLERTHQLAQACMRLGSRGDLDELTPKNPPKAGGKLFGARHGGTVDQHRDDRLARLERRFDGDAQEIVALPALSADRIEPIRAR